MQYHCMNIISNTINTLNPCQIPVNAADQQIFALTKKLMIRFLDKFGLDKYFCLFGSLHIKKSLLIICGQVIKGSGLDEILCTCDLSIVGADSLVTVNDIKRARYCLQVGACKIYSKLKQAHMDSGSDELILLWLAKEKQDIWNVFLLDTDPQTYDRFACLHTISSKGQISTIYCIVM